VTAGELYYGIGGIVVGVLAILIPVLLRYERILGSVTKRVDGIEEKIAKIETDDKHNIELCSAHELRFQSLDGKVEVVTAHLRRLETTITDIGTMKTDIAVLKETISRWDKSVTGLFETFQKEMQAQMRQMQELTNAIKQR